MKFRPFVTPFDLVLIVFVLLLVFGRNEFGWLLLLGLSPRAWR